MLEPNELTAKLAYQEWRATHTQKLSPAEWDLLGDGWQSAFVFVATRAYEIGKRTVVPATHRLVRRR